jgi:hypothetical protein
MKKLTILTSILSLLVPMFLNACAHERQTTTTTTSTREEAVTTPTTTHTTTTKARADGY